MARARVRVTVTVTVTEIGPDLRNSGIFPGVYPRTPPCPAAVR